jgi:hypothetical protein
VLAKVTKSLRGVPREHIYVYTLIGARWQDRRDSQHSPLFRAAVIQSPRLVKSNNFARLLSANRARASSRIPYSLCAVDQEGADGAEFG